MCTYIIRNNDSLQHYGVIGMKWGVRRYRNYDGSYTRAGLKRYDESMAKYEKANQRYKNAKKNKADDVEKTNAKIARNKAKKQLVKDYRHLKQDKMGDEGKKLYADNRRIRTNKRVANVTAFIGSALMMLSTDWEHEDYTTIKSGREVLAGLGAITLGTAGIMTVKANRENDNLRAYYSHTSRY